jgi:pimeloyl-ACP methyl ester carboxylesterase
VAERLMLRGIAAAACLVCAVAPPTYAQEVPEPDDSYAAIALPRGTELPLVISRQFGTQPKIAVLLFAGYPGILRIRNDGGVLTYDLRGNFLIRARRHLVGEHIFTVMVDCPKDQWTACDDTYRTSDQHADDVAAVVAKVKADLGADKVYVMATSYGTESSAYLALKLGGKLDGTIHTATFTDPKIGFGSRGHGQPMSTFDWTAIKIDQLFVHHKDDPCDLTRYRSVVARKGSAALITVQGSKGSRGDVCAAYSAHGFVGRERLTMLAIVDWILNRKVRETVGEDRNDD